MRELLIYSYIFLALSTYIFIFTNFPSPRPLLLFALLAVSAIIYLYYLIEKCILESSPIEAFSAIIYPLLFSYFLRVSGYIRVVYSGGDHYLLFQQVKEIISSGTHSSLTGLYSAAGFYLYELVAIGLATNFSVSDGRFVTILVSSLFTLVIAAIVAQLTRSSFAMLVSMITASLYPLALRTSALIEAESIVICTFAAIILIYIQKNGFRKYFLLTVFPFLLIFVHFFYGLAIIAILIGGFALRSARLQFNKNLPGSTRSSYVSITLAIALGIWVFTYVSWSGYSQISLGLISSVIHFESIPFDILDSLTPSEGTAAASTGDISNESSFWNQALRLSPVLILAIFAAVGVFCSILKKKNSKLLELFVILLIAISVVALGFSDDKATYQFRLYYFAGSFLVLFSSLAIYWYICSRYAQNSSKYKKMVAISVLIFLFFGYSVSSPISPISNNVDPQFDGESFSTTEGELERYYSVTELIAEPSSLSVSSAAYEEVRIFRSIESGSENGIRIQVKPCMSSQIWETGEMHLCYNQSSV